MVFSKADQISLRSTLPRWWHSARLKKVSTSSLMTVSTIDGRPANTNATFLFSRIKCWIPIARDRISGKELGWTSSSVINTPCSDSFNRSSRLTMACLMSRTWLSCWNSTEPKPNDAWIPAPGTAKPPEGSSYLLMRVSGLSSSSWISLLRKPTSAVSSITYHPRFLAISPRAFSMTVFPTPRAPVTYRSLPGAPTPSSRAIWKSSSSTCLPTSTGGVIPAVGLNGLGMPSTFLLEYFPIP